MTANDDIELEPRVRRIVWLMTRLERDRDVTMVRQREASAAVARRFGKLVMRGGPSPAGQRDHLVDVAGGRIRVRVYTPHGTGPFPLYVFLHGGGWCAGTIDERDPRCRAVSAGVPCVVASVEYRLAPENTYPTASEDCFAALGWLVANASELGIDADRVAVGGESAGANLAAVLCLMARDRGGPPIRFQWLDVPATDLTLSQPSVHSTPSGLLLDLASVHRYLDHYLVDRARATEPYASPLLAADLTGLPPARILTSGGDRLRDDGRAYAGALRAAGVEVDHAHLAGHVHPTFAFTRLLPSAAGAERDGIAALARALAE